MPSRRVDALIGAWKLLRTFDSAPDFRQRARAIHSELAHGDGWTDPQRARIEQFGSWLQEPPAVVALKGRCEQVLTELAR